MQASGAVPDYRRQRRLVQERLQARKQHGRRRRRRAPAGPRMLWVGAAAVVVAGIAFLAVARQAPTIDGRRTTNDQRPAATQSGRSDRSVGSVRVADQQPAAGNPPSVSPLAPPFTVVMSGETPSVELSASLRRAIRREWPGYRLPPSAVIRSEALEEMRLEHPEAKTPYAVGGDFDGDGRLDAALLLRREGRGMLAVLHGTSEGRYEGRRLLRADWSDGLYIVRQPAGPVASTRRHADQAVSTETLQLQSDGIRFNPVDGAPHVFYVEGGRYRHVEVGE